MAIIAFARVVPPPPGRAADVAAYYSSQATNLTIAAGLFALLEIGRIAFVAGVRGSLRHTTPRWLRILGVIVGTYGIVASTYQAAGGAIFPGIDLWVPAMWIWMVATGVVLFRHAGPLQADVATAPSEAVR